MKIKKTFAIFFTLIFALNSSFVFSEEAKKTVYTYDELVFLLSKNNLELQNLQEEYFRSTLDVKDAKASRGPTVDLQLSGTYMTNALEDPIYLNLSEVVDSIQWPAGTKPTLDSQYIQIYEGMENTLYNIEFSVLQPLFTWGKINKAVKLYKELSDVKGLQLISTQNQLEAELKIRLATLNYLYSIIDLIEESDALTKRLVEFSEKAEESGMMIAQDVLEARVQAKQLEITKYELSEEIKNQLLEIEKLTGVKNLSKENIDFKIDNEEIQQIMTSNREEILAKATSLEQESIKMLNQVERINSLAEQIAKGSVNWKPDIALQVSGSYGGSRVPLLEQNWLLKDDFSFNLSVGIKATVWDGGKKLRDVSRKVSETKTAKINTEDAKQTISQTLNSQWNTIDLCNLKIDYQDLKIQSLESKIKLKEIEFENGYSSEADVLMVKIQCLTEKIGKIQEMMNRDIACMTISLLTK